MASDCLRESIQCDSYLTIVRPQTRPLSLCSDFEHAKIVMPPVQINKLPLPEVNIQSKIRSVGLNCDFLEEVRFLLSDIIAVGVNETNVSSLQVVFGQLKDNGLMSLCIVSKQEWESLIKNLADINAEVQRIDRNMYVKHLKNGHKYKSTRPSPL